MPKVQPRQMRGKDFYEVLFFDRYISHDYFDNGDCIVHNRNIGETDYPSYEQRVARFVFKLPNIAFREDIKPI